MISIPVSQFLFFFSNYPFGNECLIVEGGIFFPLALPSNDQPKTFLRTKLFDKDRVPNRDGERKLLPLCKIECENLSFLPDESTNEELPHRTRWQLVQSLRKGLWKRWHNEYLHSLQQRTSEGSLKRIAKMET
ncbi:hypothetical protein CDAR_545211 [Caerostris darwini]|uniref:DUF5641 domain-containing protein n=1 Tax=Caerostris darwini TaxID=1538125 RepID=A0AAV4TK60_9ARAC|nr:hypothetical protein CDAR_545211 [Caerostris darwini]